MSRKKVSCPDWLLERIDLVNDFERMIRSGFTPKEFAKLVLREFEAVEETAGNILIAPGHLDGEAYATLVADFRNAVYSKTGTGFRRLVEYIGLPKTKSALQLQLEHLQADARSLRELARLVGRKRHIGISMRLPEYLYIDVDHRGNIKIVRSGVVSRISRDGLLGGRVRACPICNCIFWMKTARSKTCGTKRCADRADYLTNRKGKKNGSL